MVRGRAGPLIPSGPLLIGNFFGGSAGLEERVELLCGEERMTLLSDEEREEMKDFVRRKLEDRKHRTLDDWDGDGVE